jgi:hypothetical protein
VARWFNGAREDSERGAAVVELAFVSILLILLVAGIVDIGRVLFANIGLQEAAQEGAIYGSFQPNGDIEARINEAVEYPPIDSIVITCVEDVPDAFTDQIAVTVTHSVDLITPIVGQWFGGSIDLSRTVTGQVFKEAVGACPYPPPPP